MAIGMPGRLYDTGGRQNFWQGQRGVRGTPGWYSRSGGIGMANPFGATRTTGRAGRGMRRGFSRRASR